MSAASNRKRPPVESATERVARLLTMVPWLTQRQGIDIAEAAAQLGISEKQLTSDLNLLFMCGYGSMPDELIDVEFSDGHVFITNADTIAQPLRLSRAEAAGLILALQWLGTHPVASDARVIESAIAKLEEAAGAGIAPALSVSAEKEAEPSEIVETVQAALAQSRRLFLRYLVPSRDEVTEREVDPSGIVTLDGRTYLEGWCLRAEDSRLFRLDRILEARLLDAPAQRHEEAGPGRESAFVASADAELMTVDLSPDALWVAEYYPCENVTAQADGGARVTMRIADRGWAVRLLLSVGDVARIVEPADLRAEVVATAKAGLSGYSQ